MDSANNSSGSMQSSSGADEEYDSRTQSSPFLINNHPPPQNHLTLPPFATTTTTTTNFANSHTLHHHINNNTAHVFDPLSNYLQDPMQRSPSPNALLNLDMMWSSKPLRSDPNQTDLAAFIPSSPSPSPSQAHLSAGQPRDHGAAFYALQPDPQSAASRGSMLSAVSAANANTSSTNPNVQVRNPKKRSRASRRAPTTVLTTDTANFRAMVQEFTGIPAPPFPSSSPFLPRARFDLFGTSAATVRSTLLDPSPPPPYLLRPFAHKPHHSLHPPSSNSVLDNLLLASNNISTNSATNPTAVNNFQVSLSSDQSDLLKPQPQPPPLGFNNIPNILSFQNILQPPPGNSTKAQASLEIPPPISGVDSHLRVGVFEELGLRQAHVSNNNNASTEWAQRSVGTVTNDDCEPGRGGGVTGGAAGTVNYSTDVTNGGKVQHYSAAASSTDFRGEKGTECTVAAAAGGRGEGMVESWINCSSSD